MIGTIQATSGPFVQANQNKPTGKKQAPIIAGGSLDSGGADPVARVSARYLFWSYRRNAIESAIPIVMPRNASALISGAHPRVCAKMMGKAGKSIYSVPYMKAMYIALNKTIGSRNSITQGRDNAIRKPFLAFAWLFLPSKREIYRSPVIADSF
ncbi:hypothetical protein V2G26_015605 [Clonostachys chloroleuca]